MALTKKGEFWYGTTSGDTQAELRSYSIANRDEAVRFAASKCDCGCRTFVSVQSRHLEHRPAA